MTLRFEIVLQSPRKRTRIENHQKHQNYEKQQNHEETTQLDRVCCSGHADIALESGLSSSGFSAHSIPLDLNQPQEFNFAQHHIDQVIQPIIHVLSGREDPSCLIALDRQLTYSAFFISNLDMVLMFNLRKVRYMVERTVFAGESSSAVILGPPSSGKSTVCLIFIMSFLNMNHE